MMKKKISNQKAGKSTTEKTDTISRKEAIKKLGKCTALTVATMTFLSTKASAEVSGLTNPGWGQ